MVTFLRRKCLGTLKVVSCAKESKRVRLWNEGLDISKTISFLVTSRWSLGIWYS